MEAGPPRGGGGGGAGGAAVPGARRSTWGPGRYTKAIYFSPVWYFISTAPIPIGTINFMGPGRTM